MPDPGSSSFKTLAVCAASSCVGLRSRALGAVECHTGNPCSLRWLRCAIMGSRKARVLPLPEFCGEARV